jgi:hypothetical protein
MDWTGLAQDRGRWRALVNEEMNLRVPYNAGKFLSRCATGGLSRRAQLHGVSYLVCLLVSTVPYIHRPPKYHLHSEFSIKMLHAFLVSIKEH